jgi:hypothetical protein
VNVILDGHAADDLAALLGLLEDWLLHAGNDIRHDLALFSFPADGHPDLAVQHLIDQLGRTSVVLRRQLDPAGGDRR